MATDRSRNHSDWYLSIDGGGTKTDVVLLDGEKLEGVRITGSGANPSIYGEKGIETVADLIVEIVEAASVQRGAVNGCVVGMAGISNPKYRSQIERRLSDTLPHAVLTLTSDAELAHRNIWGDNSGMTLIVGTGSIALGSDSEGNMRRSGGLGFQSGDQGSGYWLGKMLLTELITAERSGADDVLLIREQILKRTGKKTFEDAIAFFSGESESVTRVANMGPLVLSFAEKRNILASQIALRGAEALASLIEDLWEKLGFLGPEIEIGVSGTLIEDSQFYQGLLENQLLVRFDSMEWVKSDYPPVYGGLLLSELQVSPEDYPKMKIRHVQTGS